MKTTKHRFLKFKDINSFDFSSYGRELTREESYLVNGGAHIENSIEAQAQAQPGDTITNSTGNTIVLNEGDILWAQQQLGYTETENDNSDTASTNEPVAALTHQEQYEMAQAAADVHNNQGENCTTQMLIDSTENDENKELLEQLEDLKNQNLDFAGVPVQYRQALGERNVINRIELSIKLNFDKQYISGDSGYMCDDWVEEVLKDPGLDSSKYLIAGKANDKSVEEHIEALKNSKNSYKQTIPDKEGFYVVFMDGIGSLGELDAHCGILRVSGDGTMLFSHNSSANGYKVDTWIVNSQNAGTKLSNLAYPNFYFQEVKLP